MNASRETTGRKTVVFFARLFACLYVAAQLISATALWAQREPVVINKQYPIDKGNISPPHVDQTNECSTKVYVDSFVPHAIIRVFRAGSGLIGGPIAPSVGFAAIQLNVVLHTGDKIAATQTVNSVTSAMSATMIVGSMPASLSAPTVDPSIYACGRIVGVHGLVPGVKVEVQDKTLGTTIGMGSTPNAWGSDWDPVLTSALVSGHILRARQSSCTNVQSPYSTGESVKADPPIPVPSLDPPILNNDVVTAHDLLIGSDLQVLNHATAIGGGLSTGSDNWVSVAPPIGASSSISASQTLCTKGPSSTPQTPTTKIPTPLLLGPICPKTNAAFVRDSTLNATLVLLRNGTTVGYGGAAPGDVPLDIAPPAAFATGDSIQVAEYIGSSITLSNKVDVGCTNVLEYHNDSQRTGWNPVEKTLTTSNVRPGTFGRIATVPLDDQVDTQPLIVADQKMGATGTHSVAYVTTESNSVYAIDAWTGAVLNSRNLGTPIANPQGCGNNGPNVGIDGTGTIDLPSSTFYLISYVLQGGNPAYQLHALDLATLADKAGSPVTISANQTLQGGTSFPFTAAVQRQRPALLNANGRIYAAFGSFCDFKAAQTRGWVLAWDKTTLAPLPTHEVTNLLSSTNSQDCTYAGNHPCYLSSIWMSGYGIAADSKGSLYFTTGNSASGSYSSTENVAESAVKLSPDLTSVQGIFTPSNASVLDTDDTDYGSGGLMVLPDLPGNFPHLAAAAGKDGRMFLLNRDNMGGMHNPDIPMNGAIGNCWCGPTFFDAAAAGAAGAPRIVSSGGDGMGGGDRVVKLWSVSNSGTQPSLSMLASGAALEASDQDGGFFTSVSSNGGTAGTAIIWAVGRASGNDTHVSLYAFNATPSGASLPLLWSDVAGSWPNTGDNSNIVPTAANGRVYVASNKELQIFGLIDTRGGRPSGKKERYWGKLREIRGSRLTLELRTGRLLEVDLTQAIAEGRAAMADIGGSMVVEGSMTADNIFAADSAAKAKGSSLWGDDIEK